VTYIVVVALINDDGEVLMMQEAKSSYAGKWYLPAGHIESGEDILVCSETTVILETHVNVFKISVSANEQFPLRENMYLVFVVMLHCQVVASTLLIEAGGLIVKALKANSFIPS
jgi:8-oxo-dGTP pyrophosphatase MutT (NUDIX family)